MSVQRETVAQRKALPIASGVLDYFPDALLAVAEVSRVGNEQHHPGEPLHWDKSKSTDEADALLRHLLDRGTIDTDGLRHSAKVAWRALALLQRELDAEAVVGVGATIEESIADGMAKLTETMRDAYRAEAWGDGDGLVYGMARDGWDGYGGIVHLENRGDWPPDTRVAGLLTCCGQTEHNIACPQYR